MFVRVKAQIEDCNGLEQLRKREQCHRESGPFKKSKPLRGSEPTNGKAQVPAGGGSQNLGSTRLQNGKGLKTRNLRFPKRSESPVQRGGKSEAALKKLKKNTVKKGTVREKKKRMPYQAMLSELADRVYRPGAKNRESQRVKEFLYKRRWVRGNPSYYLPMISREPRKQLRHHTYLGWLSILI